MSHAPMDKKARKKAQLKKNRFNQEFFHFVRLRRQEADRVEALDESREKPKHEKEEDDRVWSEQVSKIRNRLDGSRRVSKDRWNRFAGTGDAGGRGL
jgi:hypothetical protein